MRSQELHPLRGQSNGRHTGYKEQRGQEPAAKVKGGSHVSILGKIPLLIALSLNQLKLICRLDQAHGIPGVQFVEQVLAMGVYGSFADE
jgi:hypothetical protein